jgi:hypothetical protein
LGSARAVADLPLLKARRNLGIAADDLRKQQYDSVAVPLQAASSALSEYVNGKGPHAQDAAAMRSQIDAFAKNVGQHHADAVSQIDKWWNQVNDWFTPLEPPPAK